MQPWLLQGDRDGSVRGLAGGPWAQTLNLSGHCHPPQAAWPCLPRPCVCPVGVQGPHSHPTLPWPLPPGGLAFVLLAFHDPSGIQWPMGGSGFGAGLWCVPTRIVTSGLSCPDTRQGYRAWRACCVRLCCPLLHADSGSRGSHQLPMTLGLTVRVSQGAASATYFCASALHQAWGARGWC